MNTIPEIITRLRSEPFSLSQAEIAKRIDTTQSCVSRWEGGAVPDSVVAALRLIVLEHELTCGRVQ